jgi:hypothetical protein
MELFISEYLQNNSLPAVSDRGESKLPAVVYGESLYFPYCSTWGISALHIVCSGGQVNKLFAENS